MENFWNWFIGEAGAAWIFGVLGILGVVYTWLKRPRPPKVIVQEVERLKLLDIHPSQREKLKVFYIDPEGQQAIENLEQKKVVIYNTGTKDILEPVKLRMRFYQKIEKVDKWKFWRFVLDNPECTLEPIPPDKSSSWVDIDVQIPYLNSYPNHKHYLTGYLISDGEMEIELVKRIGKGWSSRYVTPQAVRKMETRLGLPIAIVTLLLVIFFPPAVFRLTKQQPGGLWETLQTVVLVFALVFALLMPSVLGRIPFVALRIRPSKEFDS